jgi:sialic acid synthase SpsE
MNKVIIIAEAGVNHNGNIDLAKKNKSLKKEVDAILTATTILKMKCSKCGSENIVLCEYR